MPGLAKRPIQKRPLSIAIDGRRASLGQLYMHSKLSQLRLRESAGRRGLSEFQIRNAGGASDFNMLLGNIMYREMMEWFRTVPQDWMDYTRTVTVVDYRPRTLVLGSESPNLRFLGQNGQYKDSPVFDRYFQVQVTKWGELFRINRTVIINDDLNYIQRQPERFGRASARTLSTFVPQAILEGNPLTFDGQPLFSASHPAGSYGTYANLFSGSGSAFGIPAIKAALAAMNVAHSFDGTLRPVDPSLIIAPPVLKWDVFNTLHSAAVVAAGGQTPDVLFPNGNPLMYIEQPLTPVIDRYLTNQTAWYLLVDPNEIASVIVAFLQGNERPYVGVQIPATYAAAGGGDDPYGIDFDDLTYKVRYEFGGTAGFHLGAAKMAGV